MAIWVGLGVFWALSAVAPTEHFDFHWLTKLIAALCFACATMHLETILKGQK